MLFFNICYHIMDEFFAGQNLHGKNSDTPNGSMLVTPLSKAGACHRRLEGTLKTMSYYDHTL